jgi:hypothetical protein
MTFLSFAISSTCAITCAFGINGLPIVVDLFEPTNKTSSNTILSPISTSLILSATSTSSSVTLNCVPENAIIANLSSGNIGIDGLIGSNVNEYGC